MNTNEPTTGEIVRALREDCSLLDDNTDKFVAADRLESQERAIAERDAYIELLKKREEALENDAINFEMNLSEMTARAESAERERDAAKKWAKRFRRIAREQYEKVLDWYYESRGL